MLRRVLQPSAPRPSDCVSTKETEAVVVEVDVTVEVEAEVEAEMELC
jgi:hypothetical protein